MILIIRSFPEIACETLCYPQNSLGFSLGFHFRISFLSHKERTLLVISQERTHSSINVPSFIPCGKIWLDFVYVEEGGSFVNPSKMEVLDWDCISSQCYLFSQGIICLWYYFEDELYLYQCIIAFGCWHSCLW